MQVPRSSDDSLGAAVAGGGITVALGDLVKKSKPIAVATAPPPERRGPAWGVSGASPPSGQTRLQDIQVQRSITCTAFVPPVPTRPQGSEMGVVTTAMAAMAILWPWAASAVWLQAEQEHARESLSRSWGTSGASPGSHRSSQILTGSTNWCVAHRNARHIPNGA